jgi:predicted tellurium resistance membrane protein TerC
MRRAIMQITIADISMSLDNVLAVAGVAIHHLWVLAVGLMLSIGLMGVAANLVAKLLNRHPWISYAGVFIVLYVACSMIYHGGVMMAAQ